MKRIVWLFSFKGEFVSLSFNNESKTSELVTVELFLGAILSVSLLVLGVMD